MVRNAQLQTWRTVESYRRSHGTQCRRKRTSSFPGIKGIGSRILEKERWKYSIHFNGDASNAKPLFRTICSAQSAHRFLVRHSEIGNWRSKKWMLRQKHLRLMFKHREIDCVISKRNSKICRKRWKWLTCETAAFMRKVSPGQCFRTIHDIDDGFGGKTGACRESSLLRDHDNCEPVGWIKGFAQIGRVIQVRATCYLDQYGIEIQEPFMLRNGSLRDCDIQRPNPLRGWSPWRKREEPPHDVEMVSYTNIEESIATKQQEPSSIPMNPPSKTCIRISNGSGMTFLRESLTWKVSNEVTKCSRHRELHRAVDGANVWCSLLPMLRREFETEGAGVFSNSKWLSLIHGGSDKHRFQYCLDSNENLMYIRAIQGHSGGALVDPELMNYVAIPLGWKEYLYHVGGSFAMHSIMQAGLVAGGKDTKEGRQTVFFTVLDRLGDELDEEYEDLSQPRRVHYKSKWRVTQDAIYWINLAKAQNNGITLWQTRPHAIILCDSVSADCIEKVLSTRYDNILYQKIPIPRPPPKIVLTIKKCSNNQASRNRVRNRKIHSKSTSRCKEYRRKSSTWRSRTNNYDSKIDAYSQNSFQNGVNDHWLSENWCVQYVQWGVQKNRPKLGKDRIIRIGWSLCQDQCPSCAKYWPEGLVYCTSGQCSMPSKEPKRKTKE